MGHGPWTKNPDDGGWPHWPLVKIMKYIIRDRAMLIVERSVHQHLIKVIIAEL